MVNQTRWIMPAVVGFSMGACWFGHHSWMWPIAALSVWGCLGLVAIMTELVVIQSGPEFLLDDSEPFGLDREKRFKEYMSSPGARNRVFGA